MSLMITIYFIFDNIFDNILDCISKPCCLISHFDVELYRCRQEESCLLLH